MLRAVLLGVLSLSVVSCKSHDETAKSQPGVAAGKVVEVAGTVTLHHGDAARPLAKGETVEGDDVIETGADGSVVIELAHNNATWDLGPNKKTKVRESLAWSSAKQDKAAKAVEQDSAAAGRHAERNAADTTASAGAPQAEPVPATVAPPAVETDRADRASERRRDVDEKKSAPAAQPKSAVAAPKETAPAAPPKAAATATKEKAPAPPPPPPKVTASVAPPPKVTAPVAPPRSMAKGGAPGGANATADVGDDFSASLAAPSGGAAPDASALVRGKAASFKECLAGSAVKVTIKVDAAGKATVVFADKVDAKVEACIEHVVTTIAFPHQQASVPFSIKP